MSALFEKSDEKKVEFIELIYDLIFVYLIGRNSALLHFSEGSFFTLYQFTGYLIATLVALQLWYFSTLFINRYGENSVREHVFLFVNMYLLYYLADGLGDGHTVKFIQYNLCWALILINTAVQYLIQYKVIKGKRPWEESAVLGHAATLLIQAAIVLISIPLGQYTGVHIAWISLVVGLVATVLGEQMDFMIPMDSEHLTERIMLYMVFTYGETIVSITDYFSEGFSLNTLYFSLLAFLIVAGLFSIYGLLYNEIIERDRHHIGFFYMLIHVGMIITLNNINVGMELVRSGGSDILKTSMFLVISFALYYLVMYFLKYYSKRRYRAGLDYLKRMGIITVLFIILSRAFYESAHLSILISALYVYAMFFMVLRRMHKVDSKKIFGGLY